MTPKPTRSRLPSFIAPQLSQLVKTPPEGRDWAHEIKHDGYRIHARLALGDVKLLTRTGLDWTDRYQTTAKALSKVKVQEAYLDGELCAVRPDGTTSFAELQAATDSRSTQDLVYFVFDLLFLNGKDPMDAPLLERKEQLQALLKRAPKSIQYSDHHIGDGKRFLEAVCGAKAEGIISKRVDAPYVPGNRGLWRKTKCLNSEEFVIVGYSDPEGSRPYFGALLLGYYDDDGRLLLCGTRRHRLFRCRAASRLRHPAAAAHIRDAARCAAATQDAVWIAARVVACALGKARAGV